MSAKSNAAPRSRFYSLLAVPVMVALGAGLGTVYSNFDSVSAATADEEFSQNMRLFSKVYEVVEDNIAEKPNADTTIYQGAIPGMLRTLDPHSSFYDPRVFALMREEQRGRYYGVGMTIGVRNNKVIVQSPFPNSPAARAGIRPGDFIVKVNDSSTEGMNTRDVADRLKGARGTDAIVVIQRPGVQSPITLKVTRDEIPRKSVNDAFWLKPGVMYIDIEQFNENTSAEFEANLRRLEERNVQGMVLDLRGNPGGILTEGVAIAEHFLKKGQLVVSHRGRASATRNYSTRRGGSYDFPVVVLVDRSSASAAEIVSGALQDHDRALIFGETTFGKGLVQTVNQLSENTGLALTTARYYTPSNRLIQRDYSHKSFFEYIYRKDDGKQDTQKVYQTDAGRTVYGGGGIMPDEKYSAEKINPFQIELLRRFTFADFTAEWFGPKEAKLPRGWQPDEAVMKEFRAWLQKKNVPVADVDWTANLDWTRKTLTREFYMTAFDIDAARQYGVETDPMVIQATGLMQKAKDLADSAKKNIVRNGGVAAPGL
jgi:carboxyl-terminal processing protease